MINVKNKMYDYEVTPPVGVWESITAELDNYKKVVDIKKNNYTKINFSFAVAATVTVLVFCLILFKNNFNKTQNQFASEQTGAAAMKVPDNEDSSSKKNNQQVAQQTDTKNINRLVSKEKNHLVSNTKSYVTIAGPEGQLVKVSSKIATLIESSDNNNPLKASLRKKISKWKTMMLTNTLAPTPGNFLDIVELNNTLNDTN